MWPLSSFESNSPFIPEIANPPTWDGIVLYLISLALVSAFSIYIKKKSAEPYRGTIIGWAIFWILLAILFPMGFANLLIVGSAVIILVYGLVVLFQAVAEQLSSKSKIQLACAGVLVWGLFCVGAGNYCVSYIYWLPASYPPDQRDQLRMIRRIVEVQPHASKLDKNIVSLSELHLVMDGKEIIPDSIREKGEYQGYLYQMQMNYPRDKLFVIDAVPIDYKPGMHSFHAFPVNPDELDAQYPYVVYCITMADRRGKPATEKDRHFHTKSLWYTLRAK
jgi:hypothetical protein